MPTNPAPNTVTQDPTSPDDERSADTQRLVLVRQQQAQLHRSQVERQFRIRGSQFHFKDQGNRLAFHDGGNRMVTSLNDDRVAKAMVQMALAKGWQRLTVAGHTEFKREVWLQAKSLGIDVRGYQPSEQELSRVPAKHTHQLTSHTALGAAASAVSAVASSYIDKHAFGIRQANVLKAAIDQRLKERERLGNVPHITTRSRQQQRFSSPEDLQRSL